MTGVTQIVVVGRDAALWLTASTLRLALRHAGIGVTAIELPSLLTRADIYATLPPLEALNARLRLDEKGLLRATDGAFSLGQNFVDLSGGNEPFLNGYGSYGAPIDGKDFFAYWIKARELGLAVPLQDFSLTGAAARAGRVMIPDDASEVYGRADYGYHLPAVAYAGILRSVADRAGVMIRPAATIRAVLDSSSGSIAAVEADGATVIGDLFVDASGDQAALIGNALGVKREDWTSHFPVDRIVVARAAPFAEIPVYAELRAVPSGWTALYPAQRDTHVVHAYASAQVDDQEAVGVAARTSGLQLCVDTIRSLKVGRSKDSWSANCVAIGAAACALDPIHNLELHAVQLGLVSLLSCFPIENDLTSPRAEYNRVMALSLNRLRDYQSAVYQLARLPGPFWTAGRVATCSSDLAHTAALFLARGELPPMEEESIASDHWRALLIGLGVVPDSYSPAIDKTDPAAIKAQFRRMLGFVKETVERQPSHAAALESARG